MITVNELIKKLTHYKELGYGKLPCIYSIDDEGNAYHLVMCEPTLQEASDLRNYNLDLYFDDTDEKRDFNCLLIN